MPDIAKLYTTYAANTAQYPALYAELAEQLGVSAESVTNAEIGFIPVDPYGRQGWALPERNAKGDVIGIQVRFDNGKKEAVPGSKRGLAYMVNRDTTQYEEAKWERTSAKYPCPLCKGESSDGSFKPSGCLYPKGEYDNPNAVTCVRISVGAVKKMELGYLHVFDLARQQAVLQNYSLLLPSDHPVLIVEGWSDVLAAYDIDFVAVGKPSGCSKMTASDLVKLVNSRDVVVMGENDAGTGKDGMEATAVQLMSACKNLTKLMPPKGVKDIRQWVEKGLTQEGLLGYISENGQRVTEKPLADDRAITVANTWVEEHLTVSGVPTFGIYAGGYVGYNGIGWETWTDNKVYAKLIGDMGYKSFFDPQMAVKNYKLTNGKINDILRSCNVKCNIEKTAPCWLTADEDKPDTKHLITLTNGILDIDRYVAGDTAHMMMNHDPNLFTFYQLPYAFDEDVESPLWDAFCLDTFQEEDKILLASEWTGYQFESDMAQEVMMVFQGPPRSGKGTYANTLHAMLGGSPNASVTTFPTLAGQFGLAPLQNALSVIIGDATADNKGGTERAVLLTILNIVGRDPAILNQKHEKHLDMVRLRCRFTFCMNFFPKFRDDSGALLDRTMIVKFNNSHSGCEDKTLKDRLAKDASRGKMLNWALRGIKSLHDRGSFTIPKESIEAKRIFASVVSPFGQFKQDCYDVDLTACISADDIWWLWRKWCQDAGGKYGGKSDFIHKLLQMTPGTKEVREGYEERMIEGIKLTEWGKKIQNG